MYMFNENMTIGLSLIIDHKILLHVLQSVSYQKGTQGHTTLVQQVYQSTKVLQSKGGLQKASQAQLKSGTLIKGNASA